MSEEIETLKRTIIVEIDSKANNNTYKLDQLASYFKKVENDNSKIILEL